jgi:hypothetical protein
MSGPESFSIKEVLGGAARGLALVVVWVVVQGDAVVVR